MRLRLALFASTALLAACPAPPPTLTITATPSKIEAGSEDVVELEITGTQGGGPLLTGKTVKLKTTKGTFIPDDPSATEWDATVESGGRAVAKLYPPANPAEAEVRAEIFDEYTQAIVSAKVTVPFTAPAVTNLQFRCFARNIMVFDHSEPMAIKCEALATDASGKSVPSAQIQFGAEAGGIYRNDENVYVYDPRSSTLGSLLEPLDVPPLGSEDTGEPRWRDGDRIRNPRDGVVTAIAWVNGVDGVDGEPYVDVDDDNVYTPGRDIFTTAMDINKNGKRDDDAPNVLWRKIRMVWSGAGCPPGTNVCRVTPTGVAQYIPKGGNKKFSFTLLDRNMNVLAANDGENDGLTWMLNGGHTMVNLANDSSRYFFNEYGINIDSRYELLAPDRRESYMRNSTYDVTVNNPEDVDPMNPTPSGQISVTFMSSRTRSVDSSGSPDLTWNGDSTISAVATAD